MAAQKKFDIVKYFLQKINVQEELLTEEILNSEKFGYILEHDFNKSNLVMSSEEYSYKEEIIFKYVILSDGEKKMIYPCSIIIPSVEWYGMEYYTECAHVNREINKNAEKDDLYEDGIMVVLDKKVILIEDWYYNGKCSTKAIELGTLTEADWKKMQLMGKAKTVITDPKEQEFYKKLCEKNNKADKEE